MMHTPSDPMQRLSTPRAPLDPILRRRLHGPVRPMDEPGMMERVLGFLRTL